MITIDLIDEQISRPEKPDIRSDIKMPKLGTGLNDPLYSLAQSRQNELMQAAHAARLLKTNGGTPIDVLRFVGDVKSAALTLVERYSNRNR
jgi:hypothetical protein